MRVSLHAFALLALVSAQPLMKAELRQLASGLSERPTTAFPPSAESIGTQALYNEGSEIDPGVGMKGSV